MRYLPFILENINNISISILHQQYDDSGIWHPLFWMIWTTDVYFIFLEYYELNEMAKYISLDL